MISRNLLLPGVLLHQLLEHPYYLLPHFLFVLLAPLIRVPRLSMASKDAEDNEPQKHGETLQQRFSFMLTIALLSCNQSISNIDITAEVGTYSAH